MTCSLGTLANTTSATVLVVVKAPTATGPITAGIAATTTTTDPTSSNNTASVTATVR